MRSFSGQSGQTSALFSCSGGLGRISSCVIDGAPCRFEVPMQSEPVSPPPITMTCLPAALIVPFGRRLRLVVAGDALVLLRQELHREMDAGELAAGHFEIARQFGAAGQRHRVVIARAARSTGISTPTSTPVRNSTPSAAICAMRRSISCFLHLEVGDAVAQQPADAVGLLEQRDGVPGARQLLRAGHAGRPRADHRDPLAGAPRRDQRHDPALVPAAIDDRAFDRFDRDRVVVDVQRAGRLARRRADAAGEFRKVVGRIAARSSAFRHWSR